MTNTLGQHAGTFNILVDVAFFTPKPGYSTVYVEAFDNAAFSGVPSARSTYAIDSSRPAHINDDYFGLGKKYAVLWGLDSQRAYYVRAYVRTRVADGNSLRKPYDSWGYVCEPERDGRRYDPMRITDIPNAPIYWLPMYATDINQNQTPDITDTDLDNFLNLP